jgi:hypothetical protein
MKYVQIALMILEIYAAIRGNNDDNSVLEIVLTKLSNVVGISLSYEELTALSTVVKEIHALKK